MSMPLWDDDQQFMPAPELVRRRGGGGGGDGTPPPRKCRDTLLLPPQSEGRRLRCALTAGHDGLHHATDPDGIHRRWPSTGPARDAAGSDQPKGPHRV